MARQEEKDRVAWVREATRVVNRSKGQDGSSSKATLLLARAVNTMKKLDKAMSKGNEDIGEVVWEIKEVLQEANADVTFRHW